MSYQGMRWFKTALLKQEDLQGLELLELVRSSFAQDIEVLARTGPTGSQAEDQAVTFADLVASLATERNRTPIRLVELTEPAHMRGTFWIKMSEPSAEALRQAFLDPESRIRPDGSRPEVRHPRIHSLSCTRAAFLGDQEIVFSPHLTCIIGGRGSGKSTLFEYLRFCLRKEKAEGARDQVERIGSTLEPSSRLDLKFRSTSAAGDELEDSVLYVKDGRLAQITSREVSNAGTVFESYGVTIFSQDELTEVARNPRIFLKVLDQLLGKELADLHSEITNKTSEIKTLFAQKHQLDIAREQERNLEQEIAELGRKVQASATLRPFQEKHRFASEADLQLSRALERLDDLGERIEALAEEAQESPVWGKAVDSWPESPFFGGVEQKLVTLHQEVSGRLRELKAELTRKRAALLGPESEWPKVQAVLQSTSKAFFGACVDHGLTQDELNRMQEVDRQLPAKQQALDVLRKANQAATTAVDQLPQKLGELAELWRRETALRRAGAARLTGNPAIPKTFAKQSTIQIEVVESGDEQEFERLWQKLAPTDLRTRLARSWVQLGQEAFQRFTRSQRSCPWEEVEAWLAAPNLFPAASVTATLEDLQSHLVLRRTEWDELRLVKVPDAIDAILYRKDGVEAGRLRNKDLSDGQRNTLLLHLLLLAEGDGPILVDQPESEVDSRFLYDQLVPLVRSIKEKRQIIFVTHNPNLPVNADAELVYALDAVSTDDRTRGVLLAQGGLDRKEVTEAVLDIMEGSEEAFRRRREKYHF